MNTAIDAAIRDRGALLVVTGEAGIGKTRLAQGAVDHARAIGYRVGWGTCWPEGGAPPLWPWPEMLGSAAGEAEQLLDDRRGGEAVDPERFARFRAIAQLIGEISVATPLLLVLEDAHAADPAAVLLARFVARASVARRVVILVTHRDVDDGGSPLADALADLADDAVLVPLAGLAAPDVVELAAAQGRPIEDQEAETLRRATNGNPLFVQELLAAPEAGGRVLPASIRRTILRRLAVLPPADRHALTAAAVLGPGAGTDEVAALAGVDLAALEVTRRAGVRTGLLADDPRSITFVHDLARAAVLEVVAPEHLAGWHRNAVRVLRSAPGRPTSEHLIRQAHHALAASPTTAEGAATAVNVCREAARALMRGFAYEAAAGLLEKALEVDDRMLRRASGLVLELAHAALASGRLLDARPLFRRAAEQAEQSGAVAELAEAVLGLGGVWVLEHRGQEEMQRYHGLLRRALAAATDRPDLVGAPADTPGGRGALCVGSPDRGRPREGGRRGRGRAGDLRLAGVAEALSILHHTMLGPRFAHDRLAIADELVATASASGDGVLTLMGLLWRTVDLLLLGRPDADRSLVEVRQRADALRIASIQLIVPRDRRDAVDTARGRLEEAETVAGAAFALGAEVGDPDAPAWYGGQLLAIRWLQRRGTELLPLARELDRSPELAVTNRTYLGAVAVLAAEAGEHDEARAALEQLCAGGIGALPETSALLVTLFEIIEAAAALGDAAVARAAYDRLLPYAPLPLIGSVGVLCLGSAERSLGVAARTMGDLTHAVDHLERAVDANRRLGHRTMLALSQAELAAALDERGNRGDAARAAAMLQTATALAPRVGLQARADVGRPGRSARGRPSRWSRAPGRLAVGSGRR